MRVIRLVLGLLLVGVVAIVWQRHDAVVAAYVDEPVEFTFEFDGLSFELRPPGERPPSPLEVPKAPDTALTRLLPVAGATTESAEPATIERGDVILGGTVTGPDGPVAGAVVRLERHTSAGVVSIDVSTDVDGRWQLSSVVGGRWRVRAFVPELLASASPVVRFVAADEDPVLDLVVVRPPVEPVLGYHGVATMNVGERVSVAVTVGRRRVDASGVVVVDPTPGVAVSLTGPPSAPARLAESAAISSAQGAAVFDVVCAGEGVTRAVASVSIAGADATIGASSAVLEVALPACVVPPPVVDESPTSTVPGGDDSDG